MKLFYTILYIQQYIDKFQYFNNKYELKQKSIQKDSIQYFYKLDDVTIIQQCLNNRFLFENTQQNISMSLLNILMIHYLLKCTSNVTPKKLAIKYRTMRIWILDNIFISDLYKDQFITEFGKAQRVYRALCRFAYIYKYKKANIPIQCDLFLNPIRDISKNYIITIFQEKTKYLFTLSDILQIIKNALFYCPYELEVEPFTPKNPYNNMPFNYTVLYNLYLHIKTKCPLITMPLYFHLFFLSDFNINKFVIQNETFLQKNAIKQFIFSSATYENSRLMTNLRDMLSEHFFAKNLRIHKDFPKDELLDIFRPYLYLYYLVWYVELFESETLYYKSTLLTLLTRFYKFNPNFGRIIIRFDKVWDTRPTIEGPCVISPYVRFFKNDKNIYEEIVENEPITNMDSFQFETKPDDSFILSGETKESGFPITYKIIRKITYNKTHIKCNTKGY